MIFELPDGLATVSEIERPLSVNTAEIEIIACVLDSKLGFRKLYHHLYEKGCYRLRVREVGHNVIINFRINNNGLKQSRFQNNKYKDIVY